MSCFLDLIFFKQTFSKTLRPTQNYLLLSNQILNDKRHKVDTHMHEHFWLLETPFYELCRLFQGAFKYITVWKLQRHAIFRYNWTISKILNHHMFSCPIFNSFNIKKKHLLHTQFMYLSSVEVNFECDGLVYTRHFTFSFIFLIIKKGI